jgi:hypothetical protein
MRNNKLFKIQFEKAWCKKDDILNIPNSVQLKVLKVYKFTWWRKILSWFGVPFKSMNCAKVKQIIK